MTKELDYQGKRYVAMRDLTIERNASSAPLISKKMFWDCPECHAHYVATTAKIGATTAGKLGVKAGTRGWPRCLVCDGCCTVYVRIGSVTALVPTQTTKVYTQYVQQPRNRFEVLFDED